MFYLLGQILLTTHVDDEDKAGVVIYDVRQNRNMICINESGLYSLVLGSKLPSAKQFKRWVTSEILATIRRTGGYTSVQEGKLNEQMVNGFIKEFENSPTNWGKNGYILKWDIVGKELNFSRYFITSFHSKLECNHLSQ